MSNRKKTKHADETTSPEVASMAAKILRDPDASPEAKSVAASALTQAPDKKNHRPAYRVLKALTYYDNTARGEVGEIVTDLPVESIPWLLEQNCIELVAESEDR